MGADNVITESCEGLIDSGLIPFDSSLFESPQLERLAKLSERPLQPYIPREIIDGVFYTPFFLSFFFLFFIFPLSFHFFIF